MLTVTDAGDTSDSYVDAGLLGQATYYYRIQAINNVTTSAYSASYELTTATATDSYSYTVQPYYSLPAPTGLNGGGTGLPSSADDFTGTINGLGVPSLTPNGDGTYTGRHKGVRYAL